MDSGIKIRRFRKGDERGIKRVLESIQRPITLQEWNWRFMENPFGRPGILVAETDGGELVGHIGTFPMELKIGSEIVRTWQIVDSAVLESFRGRGIFSELFRKGMESGKREGMAFFGFTNELAMKLIGGKSGLTSLLALNHYTKLMNSRPLLRRLGIRNPPAFIESFTNGITGIFFRNNSFSSEGIEFEEIKSFGKDFDLLAGKISARHNLAVNRSSSYLNWRFMRKPTKEYTAFAIRRGGSLSGYVVVRLGKTSGQIVDLFLDGKKGLLGTLGFCEEFFRKGEADSFSIRIYSPQIESELGKAGFVKNFLSEKSYFFLEKEKAEIMNGDLRRIHLIFGDSDWL